MILQGIAVMRKQLRHTPGMVRSAKAEHGRSKSADALQNVGERGSNVKGKPSSAENVAGNLPDTRFCLLRHVWRAFILSHHSGVSGRQLG